MGKAKRPSYPPASLAATSYLAPPSVYVRVRDQQVLHAVFEGLAALGIRAIIGDPNGTGIGSCPLCVVELPDAIRDLNGLLSHSPSARVLAVLKGREVDGIEGMALRAVDDFIVSPWHEKEFVWRVERLMNMGPRIQPSEMSLGPISIQVSRRKVLVEGRPVKLTKIQYHLLSYLLANAERVVSRAELMERIWGTRHGGSASLIGTHMHGLRRRLGSAGGLIVTVRGVGYMLSYASS